MYMGVALGSSWSTELGDVKTCLYAFGLNDSENDNGIKGVTYGN